MALGDSFSPTDRTHPLRLDALAQSHAEPGSTCYGCHQFLDPMRDYFRTDFDVDYRRNSRAPMTAPSFAFQGKTRDGGNLSDFATTLAEHPKFATGCAQGRFSPDAPEPALDDLVQGLMGLDAEHPEHDSARATLGEHYRAARARSNPVTALRSAFIVACMSPQVMGLGL